MNTRPFTKIKLALLFFCFFGTSQLIAQIVSTSDGGSWASDTTWVGGVVPTSANDVIITAGSNVVVRSPYSPGSGAACNSITIDGTLTIGSGSTSSRELDVITFLLINSGGVLTNDGINAHQLKIAGDFTNNGIFIPALNTGSIQVTFNGTGTQVIDSNDLGSIVINKISGQVEVSSNVATLGIISLTLTDGDFIAPPMMTIYGNVSNNDAGNGFQVGTGTVIFNGIIGIAQSIGGSVSTTFNNVTCTNNAIVTPTRATTVNGNLTIENGSTFNVGGFDFAVNGTTNVGNGSTGSLNFTSSTGSKSFTGLVTVSQDGIWNNTTGENISFHGGISQNGTFNASTATCLFVVNSQAVSGTISASRIEAEAGVTLTNNGSITASTALAGNGNLAQGADATLNIGGSSIITGLTASATGNTVNYIGGAQTIRGINYVNLGLSGTGTKTLSGLTTSISGNLSLSGAALATTVTPLTVAGNLAVSESAVFTIAGDNVTITGTTLIGSGGKLVFSSTTGVKTFTGLITVDGTWDNVANENIHIQGGLTNNGTFNAGTGLNRFQVNSQALGGTLTIPNAEVETGVTLSNYGTLTVTTDLLGAGTFVQGSGSVLNLQAANSVASLNTSGVNNTVNYTGGAQTVRGINYVNLGLSGTGAKTLQAGTTNISGSLTLGGSASTSTVIDLTIDGNLALSPGTNFTNNNVVTINGTTLGLGGLTQSSDAILNIYGDCQLSSITASATGNSVNYYTASPSIIPGSYVNLNLNQISGNAILYGDVTVGDLALNTGNLDIQNHNLLIAGSISIASPSASTMIITSGSGEVRKLFTATGSFIFPIGEVTGTSEYSPIEVQVLSATGFSSAYIGVSVVDAKHPNNGSSTDFLTRYWGISQSGISGCEIAIVATYLNNDISGTEGNIVSGKLTGTFNQVTNGWQEFQFIGNNLMGFGALILPGGQPSFFTGISALNPTVTITGGDGPVVCVGTSVPLDALVVGGDSPFVYAWSPTTGLSATDIANPSAEPHSTTTYTLTIYDANGNSASDETVITTQQPTVTVNSLEFCNGESGLLTAGGADTYLWSPATGLSATTGTSVTADPIETTIYTVIGTDINLCADTVTTTVTVTPVPAKPIITPSDINTGSPKLTSSSVSGNQWYKDGVIMNTETGKVLSVTEDGSYTVQVTADGCTSPFSDAYDIVIVGLREDNIAGSSRLYPNPAQDIIQFDRSKFLPGVAIEVKLYDMMGRLQVNKILIDGESSLDVKSLANGQHIFVARQNNVLVIQKFVKH